MPFHQTEDKAKKPQIGCDGRCVVRTNQRCGRQINICSSSPPPHTERQSRAKVLELRWRTKDGPPPRVARRSSGLRDARHSLYCRTISGLVEPEDHGQTELTRY